MACALLALLLRVGLLLAPGPCVSPAWVRGEEIHRGNVARELIEGPLLDFQDYQFAETTGGSIVVSALAVPFVAVLGPNLLAVRLPTVLLHVIAVWILFILLERRVGTRAAWCGGLLFAMGPPGYVLLTITAWGTHHEMNTLALLALFVFLDLQARPVGTPGTNSRGFLLGLVLGFACWFEYSTLPVLLALVLATPLLDRAFFRRRWFAQLLFGFGIGVLPWVRFNVTNGWRAFTLYEGSPVSLTDLAAHARKLGLFWGRYVPDALYLRAFPAVDLTWARIPVAVAIAVTCGIGLWRAGRGIVAIVGRRAANPGATSSVSIELVCLLFGLCFSAGILLAQPSLIANPISIAHDGRYAAPLWPFACLAVGVGFQRLAQFGKLGLQIANCAVVFLLVTFLAGFAALVDTRAFPGSYVQAATSDEELARFIAWKYKTDPVRLGAVIAGLERRSEDVRDGTIFVLAQALRYRVQRAPALDPDPGRYAHCLRYLREHVPARYAYYCEYPWPGERVYGWYQRESFRQDRLAHIQRLDPAQPGNGDAQR